MNDPEAFEGRLASDTVRYVDTHCHLDDDVFALDLDEVLQRSRAAEVTSWVNIGYTPERWRSTIDLSSRYPGITPVLGLHPSEADRWSAELCDDLQSLVLQCSARAVGESGIDLFRGETNLEQQTEAFTGQLSLAKALELPIVVHMRASEPEVLEILGRFDELPQMVFHSFEGGQSLLRFILERGCFVGVGGLAMRPRSVELQALLTEIPLEQILLETDSPYLAPTQHRNDRNEPGNLPLIGSFLAELLETEIEDLARVTTRNAERLFGRPASS